MIFPDAHQTLARVLAPMGVDEFLDGVVGTRFVKIGGDARHNRAGLLGQDPQALALGAFAALAPHIGFHAAEPLGPPPPVEPVADALAFRAKIEAFHALGYTVRLPQPRQLSPGLGELLRTLEFFFHKPATAEAFWSRGDARAPTHHDNYDLIAIQLRGRKRWFISTEPLPLPNAWESIPKGPETLGRHETVEVGPGDLLYLPRGTTHRVDALEDSFHLSIGFVPITLREAIIAALDHLSDLDRPLRQTAGQRLAFAVRRNDFRALIPGVREGVARLARLCQSDEFVGEAMQRRSSRAIKDLAALTPGKDHAAVSVDSVLRHEPSAICHLMGDAEKIDFSYPGGHIYIHRGVEEAVRFIAETPEFRIGDLPGAFGDDIRLALAEKFLASGFLRLAGE
jgi:hypothetical protein